MEQKIWEKHPDPKTEGDFVVIPRISRGKLVEDVERKSCQGCQTISISVMILEQILVWTNSNAPKSTYCWIVRIDLPVIIFSEIISTLNKKKGWLSHRILKSNPRIFHEKSAKKKTEPPSILGSTPRLHNFLTCIEPSNWNKV